jgi:hypothetical protein
MSVHVYGMANADCSDVTDDHEITHVGEAMARFVVEELWRFARRHQMQVRTIVLTRDGYPYDRFNGEWSFGPHA